MSDRTCRATLEAIDSATRHFGSLTTTRTCRRRDVLRAVERGLVQSVGNVYVCDEDGGICEPEIIREGFVLTDAGRATLARIAT